MSWAAQRRFGKSPTKSAPVDVESGVFPGQSVAALLTLPRGANQLGLHRVADDMKRRTPEEQTVALAEPGARSDVDEEAVPENRRVRAAADRRPHHDRNKPQSLFRREHLPGMVLFRIGGVVGRDGQDFQPEDESGGPEHSHVSDELNTSFPKRLQHYSDTKEGGLLLFKCPLSAAFYLNQVTEVR